MDATAKVDGVPFFDAVHVDDLIESLPHGLDACDGDDRQRNEGEEDDAEAGNQLGVDTQTRRSPHEFTFFVRDALFAARVFGCFEDGARRQRAMTRGLTYRLKRHHDASWHCAEAQAVREIGLPHGDDCEHL
ncbi:hypothetical protein [Paraburkholderia sp. UCT2]|uniref:hypothetical protein n=1 Tax=Paraburkholderia sp. UCT2 TaxID=2615208 RepID=UPI00223C3FC1|nr:hypothetical protein [Paraburkholderia sp. UCT2]